MTPSGPKKPSPFSLRLTFEERAALEQHAADMPLGAYIRSRVFDQSRPPRRTRGKRPVKDHAELAQLMAALGHSRLSTNVNQLARAVNSGSLPVTPDTEKALKDACADIAWMRIALMKSLGLYEA
tara:strand:- start:4483 stop:4857 length:375 start_codon:yes stop_codon:yes gene_type:complete